MIVEDGGPIFLRYNKKRQWKPPETHVEVNPDIDSIDIEGEFAGEAAQITGRGPATGTGA